MLDGWRIQQHVWTKHYRLLDTKDRRHAWGSYESCRCKLAHIRYARGLGEKIETEAVVLLHGIVRSKDSLKQVKNAIEEQGYEVLDINYPSRKGQIADFAKQIHDILNKRPDIKRVSFVTHSMGGLIVRKMLNSMQSRGSNVLKSNASSCCFRPIRVPIKRTVGLNIIGIAVLWGRRVSNCALIMCKHCRVFLLIVELLSVLKAMKEGKVLLFQAMMMARSVLMNVS